VTGGVVVLGGGGEVVALDARSGKKLWAHAAAGLTLLGAGDDGKTTAVTLTREGRGHLLVIGRDGQVRSEMNAPSAVGTPAVVGGVVFVPWANQYVSALDAANGEELGRVTLRDKVTHATAIGKDLYFGEVVWVRFDEKIASASGGGASRVGIPARELPGTPRLRAPGNELVPPVAGARDRDRLFARPVPGERAGASIDAGRFYATYFQLVMGFDAARGNLAWVHTHGNDVLGGEAVSGGLAICDAAGKLTVLDAQTGRIASEASFGEPIKSCVVHADSFRAAAPKGEPSPLAAQIQEALATKEASLATGQRLLLRELATQVDANATKTLIDIASDPRAAPVLVADARTAIATRRNGAQHMISALGRHYDYLRDVLAPPPVGPMADALGAMKEANAAPLLASHLLDPATGDDDVKRVASALGTLATKDELPVLRQFFAMYRGTSESEEVSAAVVSVASALLRLDPKDGRALVEEAAKDPGTVEGTRQRLEALIAAAPAPAATPPASATKPDAGAP
jgi:outer membrane protein assembly factor BamB